MSYGILLLRVVVGLIIAAHGAQKMFGWFGGPGLRNAAQHFGDVIGFRAPVAMVLLANLAELSALAFAAGFATPFVATLQVALLMTAIITSQWAVGFWNYNGGYEFNLVVIAAVVAVAATGPGRFSLDRAAGWDDELSGVWWGAGTLGVGIAAAIVISTVFRRQPRAPALG